MTRGIQYRDSLRQAQVKSAHTTRWIRKTEIEKRSKNKSNARVTDNKHHKNKNNVDELFCSYQTMKHFQIFVLNNWMS